MSIFIITLCIIALLVVSFTFIPKLEMYKMWEQFIKDSLVFCNYDKRTIFGKFLFWIFSVRAFIIYYSLQVGVKNKEDRYSRKK